MAARALALLDDRELRARIGCTAKEQAVEMQPEQIARRVIAVYEELVARRTSPQPSPSERRGS
jgi:hypothetical protein